MDNGGKYIGGGGGEKMPELVLVVLQDEPSELTEDDKGELLNALEPNESS